MNLQIEAPFSSSHMDLRRAVHASSKLLYINKCIVATVVCFVWNLKLEAWKPGAHMHTGNAIYLYGVNPER